MGNPTSELIAGLIIGFIGYLIWKLIPIPIFEFPFGTIIKGIAIILMLVGVILLIVSIEGYISDLKKK